LIKGGNKMRYVRVITVEIPSYKYFRDELGWDVDDKEDIKDYLDDMEEKEFWNSDENPFICDVESYSKIK
jgi:hypothetical protein